MRCIALLFLIYSYGNLVVSQEGRSGSKVFIEDYPYHAAVLKYGGFICSGSIIDEFHILTAAQCINSNLEPSAFSVRVGSSFQDHGGLVAAADKIIQHPEFNRHTLANDIAIIVLDDALRYTRYIQPIDLPSLRANLPSFGREGTVTSWCKTRSINQLKVSNPRIAIAGYCTVLFYFSTENTVDSNSFCAGNQFLPSTDACSINSGSPFVYKGRLFGIASDRGESKKLLFPDLHLYTSIVGYLDFIWQHT